ncbi:SpoIIE family protein phosphatase [Sediminibacillus albus]|uniref:Negative regulator of sigma-B (Phosphoserine phosphatase) n=1 Tax=Sediminibacillus albus TaxID=407036 RepID=A0A1G9AXA4_9BACI|nr:SpoIIE family protein phosphatase [Sediminibacillus albus]SDK31350.1 negative regulator of sigma-B (phosphoserine phosphatase) [Sediminibacillus albus]
MAEFDKNMRVAVYQEAKKGNYYCGDSYYYQETDNEFICALADGLGSGEHAKESSQAVMDVVEENIHADVEQLIKICNERLVGKRGVVLGVLKINFLNDSYSFSSIGNIGIMTITDDQEKKRSIPNSGYLGGYRRPFKVFEGKMDPGMIFIMFSDGVNAMDLSAKYFLGKDVDRITETYSSLVGENKNDDTTLIAMKYSRNKP